MSQKREEYLRKVRKIADSYVDTVVNIADTAEKYSPFNSLLGLSVIPPWLRNRIVENEDKEIVKNPEEPITQPIEPNITEQQNEVYKEPQIIYKRDVFNITNIYNELPQKPSSLLPVEEGVENLAQSPTKIQIGAPISLAQSVNNQKFGQMLFNPFTQKKQVIRQANTENAIANLVELNNTGIERFAGYLAKEPEHNLLDAVVLLVPVAFRGSSGGFGMIFGADTIKYKFADHTASSVNALIGVSDLIPNSYVIKDYDPSIDTVELDSIQAKLSSQVEGGTLELGDIVNQDVNFEEWIEGAVNLQYGLNKSERNLIKVDTIADLIRHALAPFYFRTGLKDLPFILPETLNQDPASPTDERQVELKQLSEFLIWQVKAIDSVLGQFPIKIRVQDTDLIQTGDQTLELDFPNLAELLTEMFGLALTNQTNNNVLLKSELIGLSEIAQTKQQAIQNYYLSAAIQEYLGFKSNQKTKDVDFLFNPAISAEKEEDQTLNNLFKPTTLKVSIESNDEDNTLEKHIFSLIEAARIIKAVHWRNVDLKGNPGKQIADRIKQAGRLSDSLSEKEEDNLKDFLDNVERGFTNKIPTKDPNKPFNRNYSERPKIKHNIKDDNNSNSPRT